jgi:hypothetical protein
LLLRLQGGGDVFIYPKGEGHTPASITTCQVASRTPRASCEGVGWRSPGSRTLRETSCPFCSSDSRSPGAAALGDGRRQRRISTTPLYRCSRRDLSLAPASVRPLRKPR